MVQATGEVAQFGSFTAFVQASPPKGLGADVDMLKRMCDEDALQLLREEVTGECGDNQHTKDVDNINNRSDGTSKDYILRHTFATRLYRSAGKIRMVQKALGHSDLSTTMIYTYVVDEELEEAMKGL